MCILCLHCIYPPIPLPWHFSSPTGANAPVIVEPIWPSCSLIL
jgi:hypothetical protein